jgi:hypothetical protein
MIKNSDMEDLKLEKLLYTDRELQKMLGVTYRMLAWYRKNMFIAYIDTKPIRYTRKMIADFIDYANKYPESLVKRGSK